MSTSSGERLDEIVSAARKIVKARTERDVEALVGAANLIASRVRRINDDWGGDDWRDTDPLARYEEWTQPRRPTEEPRND